MSLRVTSVISLLSVNRGSTVPQPANVQIVAKLKNSTGLGSPYVVSGIIGNLGGSASNPVDVLITVTDTSNNTIVNMITSPDPNVLQPRQNASFSREFSTSDLGGYSGQFWVYATVQQQ